MQTIRRVMTHGGFSPRSAAKGLLALALSLSLGGCFTIAAQRDISRDGTQPWWCQGGSSPMTDSECLNFSAYLDVATAYIRNYPTELDYTAAGATSAGITGLLPQVGQAYYLGAMAAFDPKAPNVISYDSNGGSSRPIAVGWAVDDTGAAPAGFAGDADNWTLHDGKWWLFVWVVRGYENHPDVFTTAHPCINSSTSLGTLTSTTDACFVASHTVPLEILVTNDDGYFAEGIAELVNGLSTVPGVVYNVVAPATQQSGKGSTTTPRPHTADNEVMPLAGNYPAVAVEGTPSDSVDYALRVLRLSPDLAISGINEGQNLASLGNDFSGTIGAARRALLGNVDAIATSAGQLAGPVVDFHAAVDATLDQLEQWRLGLAGKPYVTLPNINTPTCPTGTSITGTTTDAPVGVDLSSGPLNGGKNYFSDPDCTSTKTTFVDDLDAFLNGWTSIADMGQSQPPNWP